MKSLLDHPDLRSRHADKLDFFQCLITKWLCRRYGKHYLGPNGMRFTVWKPKNNRLAYIARQGWSCAGVSPLSIGEAELLCRTCHGAGEVEESVAVHRNSDSAFSQSDMYIYPHPCLHCHGRGFQN